MKPETRLTNIFQLLDWKGGTVHQVCEVLGLEVNSFLYGSPVFEDGCCPTPDFQRGYFAACSGWLDFDNEAGNLEYWFGAICAVQNNFEEPE